MFELVLKKVHSWVKWSQTDITCFNCLPLWSIWISSRAISDEAARSRVRYWLDSLLRVELRDVFHSSDGLFMMNVLNGMGCQDNKSICVVGDRCSSVFVCLGKVWVLFVPFFDCFLFFAFYVALLRNSQPKRDEIGPRPPLSRAQIYQIRIANQNHQEHTRTDNNNKAQSNTNKES